MALRAHEHAGGRSRRVRRADSAARTARGSIRRDDLVIVEARDAQSDVHVMATPLAYIYGRNVLVLNSARPDKAVFATFLEWARARYRRVLFVGGGGTDLLSHRYAIKALSSYAVSGPRVRVIAQCVPAKQPPQGI